MIVSCSHEYSMDMRQGGNSIMDLMVLLEWLSCSWGVGKLA